MSSRAYNKGMQRNNVIEDEFDAYQELVKDKVPELFCDACGFYPIEPVHGHFVCPSCRHATKCCEGLPAE